MKYLSLPLALASGLMAAPLMAQEKLKEVIVIASRVETPLREVGASVSVIEREEIELRGYPTVAELLRTQPGVAVTNTGGSGKQTSLRIRGEDGYRTLVLIDGVEVSDPTGPQVGPRMDDLMAGSEIERIEVLRGPQGFIYGADAGGVVQIHSRRAESGVQGQMGLETGRYGSRKFNGFIAAGGARGDAFIAASDWATDGFSARTSDIDGDADGYANTTLHGKFGWNFVPKWRTQLVVRDTRASSLFDNCYVWPNLIHDCTSDYEQTTAKWSMGYKGASSSHEFAVGHTETSYDSFSAGQLAFGSAGRIQKAEYLGQVKMTDSFAWVFGGDVENTRVDVENSDDLEQDQAAIFSELQFGFAERLFMTAGLRYDDNNEFGEHLSARVSSAYLLPAGEQGAIKLRASAGNGFRAPSPYEIAYNRTSGFGAAAAAALQEETSSGYDLGVEYYRESGLSAQITWFEQSIEDEIAFDLVAYSGYLQADGRSHSKGAELQLILPASEWTRLETSFTRNLTETALDSPRIRRPGKVLNMSLYLYPLADLVVLANNRWSWDAVDGADLVALDNYRVLDISANYTLVQRWEIFARVENALDEDYQEVPGYNTASRSAHIGTRFSF